MRNEVDDATVEALIEAVVTVRHRRAVLPPRKLLGLDGHDYDRCAPHK
jgi:hypothetical protein